MFRDSIIQCAAILAFFAGSCTNSKADDCGESSSPSATTSCSTAKKSQDDPQTQDLGPIPGEGPAFSAVSATAVTVSWSAATDTVTAASSLEYQLVSAATVTPLENVSEALEAHAVLPWTANALSYAVSDLSPKTAVAFNVLVKDELGNVALYTAALAPTSQFALAFSQISMSGFTVSWSEAPSSVTAAANMEYRGVIASSLSAIDSPEEVLSMSGSSVLFDWTKARLSTSVSGLSSGVSYAVAVLGRDAYGTHSLYGPAIVTTLGPRLIFMTQESYTPTQLSPTAAADALCNASKPSNRGSFKAMIAASDRVACTSSDCLSSGAAENIDWVMAPLTKYENSAGSLLWTTDASGIVPGNPTHTAIYPAPGSNIPVWTGINSGWRNASDNCQNWTSTSSGISGFVGSANYLDSTAWTFIATPCNQSRRIYCVEQ